MNMIVALLIIGVLIGIIIFLISRLNLQKSYYAYSSNELAQAEERSSKKIKELEDSIEHLSQAAYTDITTKIGNRDYFIKRTIEMLSRGDNRQYTLIGFGVANIAKVNKMYGPSEGDRLIRYVAQRLKENTKIKGVYALVQTNLFAIMLQTGKDEEVLALINSITKDIESCSDIFQVELAFGIYRIADKNEKISEMLSRMVLAQRAVGEGDKKNYAYFDEELNRIYEENKKMCEEMEQALDDRKFVMFLQPMIDLHEYKVYSAEALVRWEHEEKGLLSPYAFLPIFENTNLMMKLDYYMWEQACITLRRWIDNKIEPIPLMVNISPIHLNSAGFVQILSDLVDKYKLQRDMLVLELPERALTSKGVDAQDIVMLIARSGYDLCIDNFGSFHSPVNLLRELPLSMVKLDRKFLMENSKDEEGETILRYLIAMAKELDLTVITEGVETLEQVNFLTEIGCDIAQGYYFSKPVNLRDFDSLNKKIKREGARPNEYYPTLKDLEEGVDILEKMMGNIDRE